MDSWKLALPDGSATVPKIFDEMPGGKARSQIFKHFLFKRFRSRITRSAPNRPHKILKKLLEPLKKIS